VDEHSFTRALIEILTVASKQDPFSVGWLHSRVLSRLKCWSPSVKPLAGGGYVYERQPRGTPIYSLLSETRPRRSIVLGPLPIPSNKQGSGKPTPIELTSSSSAVKSNGSSSNGRAECLEQAQRSKKVENLDGLKELTKVQCSEKTECAQILLAIRIDETPFNQEDWVEWLRNVPVNGRDIRIEGTWDSFSTLILLRMPIEVWNLMPEHPAYSFVGFVTSGNLALNHTRSDGETTCDEASNPELTPESEVSTYIGNEWSESPWRPRIAFTYRQAKRFRIDEENQYIRHFSHTCTLWEQ
jgi:hypothetical protein